MDLSQYGISNSAGSGAQVNVPGLDGIQNTLSGIQSLLPIITIGSFVVSIVFLVLYIIHIIHRWKVDKAIIETHKEVRAIRVLLEYKQNPPAAAESVVSEPQETPPPAPAAE